MPQHCAGVRRRKVAQLEPRRQLSPSPDLRVTVKRLLSRLGLNCANRVFHRQNTKV